MKVKTRDGKVIPLASSISVLSGYGSVSWYEIEEFIPEPHDYATGLWSGNLKVK